MHKLLRSLKGQMSRLQQAHFRHALYYERVARKTTSLYQQGADFVHQALSLFDTEWENISHGQAWAASRAAENDDAAKLCSKYPDAGVYCLTLRQHPRDRIQWFEAALTAARKLRDRRAESYRLGNIGLAYAHLGETRHAIEYHHAALVIARQLADLEGQEAFLTNLGLGYRAVGDYDSAISHHG